MRIAIVAALALSLAACQSTRGLVVRAGCGPAVSAEIEAEPVAPELTAAQRTAMYRAIFGALGEVLTVAYIKHVETTGPAWGRRQAARLEAAQAECGTLPNARDVQLAR